jgi:hypothetical protein
MITEITYEQYKKLLNYPEVGFKNVKEGQKVFVDKNIQIKKLELREYLKDKGLIQVFKPEEADIWIVKRDFIDVSHYRVGYGLKASGIYIYNGLTFNELKRCWEHVSYGDRYLAAQHEQSHYDYYSILMSKDIQLVQYEDAQTELYNWQLEKNKYQDFDKEYDFERIAEILASDSYKIGVQILKKLNMNQYLEDLVYFLRLGDNKNMSWRAFSAIEYHLFRKDVRLKGFMKYLLSNSRYWHTKTTISKLIQMGIPINVEKMYKYGYTYDLVRERLSELPKQ